MNTALFIGRFQPLHNGHVHAIKQIIAGGFNKIIIGIGSSEEELTWKNPFSFWERKEMIQTLVSSIDHIEFQILPIPDFMNSKRWVDFILNELPKFDRLYSGNAYVEFCFKNTSVDFKPIKVEKIIKAANIRISIVKDINWESWVPNSVKEYLLKIKADTRLKKIYEFDQKIKSKQNQKNIKPVKKVLIVEKFTDLECIELEQTQEINQYNSLENLQQLHNEHTKVRNFILSTLEEQNIEYHLIKVKDTDKQDYSKFDGILSLGGDGTFLRASKKITSQFIVGINTQLSKSVGHLTFFNIDNINQVIESLKKGTFKIDLWDRISVKKNGQKLPYKSINEVFIGIKTLYKTSHVELRITNQRSIISGNGLIVSTFKGCTAFYRSAGGAPFTEDNFAYIALLPYKNKGSLENNMILNNNQKIDISPIRLGHSLVFDSDESTEIKLDQEDWLTIEIDPKDSLQVISPKL